ncbi:MAG: hypothetical protein PHD07_05105 [Bacteroidales bacterium]|nr:hypothetical protein [Bacteroidales bacterium]MDD3201430.1 hypothetical protein [Bacteroidales bacterium]
MRRTLSYIIFFALFLVVCMSAVVSLEDRTVIPDQVDIEVALLSESDNVLSHDDLSKEFTVVDNSIQDAPITFRARSFQRIQAQASLFHLHKHIFTLWRSVAYRPCLAIAGKHLCLALGVLRI